MGGQDAQGCFRAGGAELWGIDIMNDEVNVTVLVCESFDRLICLFFERPSENAILERWERLNPGEKVFDTKIGLESISDNDMTMLGAYFRCESVQKNPLRPEAIAEEVEVLVQLEDESRESVLQPNLL